MGQRSATETLAGIYQAFLSRRTWKQSDLARELGVSPEVLRRVLYELQERGMPLEREEDHPQVYWSVRKHWYPGSVVFKQEEVPELLRQLRRIPHGQGRARLLALVLDCFPAMANEPAAVASVTNVNDLLVSVEVTLSKKDRAAVKTIATELPKKIVKRLVIDWRKSQMKRAAVRVAIKAALEGVYEHVYESYWGDGKSKYLEAAAT